MFTQLLEDGQMCTWTSNTLIPVAVNRHQTVVKQSPLH